jgi:hypothetical protein
VRARVAAVALCLGAPALAAPPAPRELPAVAKDALCVTHGALSSDGGAMHIGAPAVRAFGRGAGGEAAGLRFKYLGPTPTVSKLASGAVRAQLGLKLRAQDGCNLIYVMWRFAPKPELVVQLKRNPGAHTNAECGTRGYSRVAAEHATPVDAPEAGSAHALQAEIAGGGLTAWIDGRVVWQGALPEGARDLAGGPAGLRADNVAAELELLAAPAADGAEGRCPAHVTDDD